MDTISFNVNNGGTLVFEQERHDGAVEAVVWDTDKNGVRDVRRGYTISPGDMVLLFDHYHNCKQTGAAIIGEQAAREAAREIEKAIFYLLTHNKNYTKKQYHALEDLAAALEIY